MYGVFETVALDMV